MKITLKRLVSGTLAIALIASTGLIGNAEKNKKTTTDVEVELEEREPGVIDPEEGEDEDFEIEEGELGIRLVSHLRFYKGDYIKDVGIGKATGLNRNTPAKLGISDKRTKGTEGDLSPTREGWNVTVKFSDFKKEASRSLIKPKGVITLNGEKEDTIYVGDTEVNNEIDKVFAKLPLIISSDSNDSVFAFGAKKGYGNGDWTAQYNKDTSFLDVSNIKEEGKYKGTLTWTLNDVPSGGQS